MFLKKIIKKIFNLFDYNIVKKKSLQINSHPNIINSIVSNPNNIPSSTIIQYSELQGDVKIGERCLLHKVNMNGTIQVGNNTSINGPGTEFASTVNQIQIGNFCSIARHTAIQDHNHNTNSITTYFIKHHIFKEATRQNDLISKGDIIIGNDVWIGTQSVILTGVTIGNGAVVAANSLVTKDVPPYAIVGGTPAKILKYRFSDEIIAKLSELNWWDWDIEKIKRNKYLFYGDLTMDKLNNIVE